MRLSEEFRTGLVERLKELQGERDWEAAHVDADDILCNALETLGYDDIVEAWHKVGKWYA